MTAATVGQNESAERDGHSQEIPAPMRESSDAYADLFKTRVELPTSKGKFRNMFPEMVPKPKRTCDCGLPIRDEAESK